VKRLFGRRVTLEAGKTVPMPETEDTRPCPHCQQPISRGATVCLHCEREVTPVMGADLFIQIFGAPDRAKPVEDGRSD
jgi:hypothetical protein